MTLSYFPKFEYFKNHFNSKNENFDFNLFPFFCLSANAQTLQIVVEPDHFGIDSDKKIIVSHLFEIDNYSNLSDYQEIEISFDLDVFVFKNLPIKLAYEDSYLLKKGTNEYRLFLTQLPLIFLNTTTPIVDDPKNSVDFIYADENQVLHEQPGVEIRGGFSQTFPKKTYDLEFWKDGNSGEKIDVQFRNLRNDDDWVLDALYNEPLRIRTHIAHKLWLKIHNVHYILDEPKAKAGADIFFTEMFLDGKYNGIYVLSEQVDRKLLKLEKYDNEIRGELYKGITWNGGAVTYSGLPSLDNDSRFWGGYEAKYPQEEEATDWTNLYDLTDFVMNASDADFNAKIWSKIHFENFRDYYIYLNLLRARDNTGKNLFMAKRDSDEPFFCSPWDLDACFGTSWKGDNDPRTDNLLSNGLYDRLLRQNSGSFKGELHKRWTDLRSTVLSDDELQNMILNTYQFLKDNNIYEREKCVYPNYAFNQTAKNYISNWTEDRLAFLDDYFGSFAGVPANSTPNLKQPIFYPNPTTGVFIFKNVQFLQRQKFEIFDIFGVVHLSDILEEGRSIDISKLPHGIYFLKSRGEIFRIFKM